MKEVRNQFLYIYAAQPLDVRFAHAAGIPVVQEQGGIVLLTDISSREARLACEAIAKLMKTIETPQTEEAGSTKDEAPAS